MKLFVVALLVAAASAQPFLYQGVVPTAYHTGVVSPAFTTPYVNSYLHGAVPSVYGLPSVYAGLPKPAVQPKSEVDHKMQKKVYSAVPEMKQEEMKPMMKEMPKEEVAKPIAYTIPTPFGYQPVVNVEYKVERPARFHQKNGAIEKTVYKRSADADADALYPLATPFATTYMNTFPHASVYGLPSVYSHPAAAASVYGLPSVYGQLPIVNKPIVNAVPKVVHTKPVVDTAQKTIANDFVTPFMYAGKGQHKAETPGTAHYAKRDADADPALIYSSGYGFPTAYTTGYSSYVPSVYRTPYVSSPYTSYYGRNVYGF